MPAKKEAVSLQKELLNQEQWDQMLTTEGLTVVDIYQKWCGPCKAVQGLFRRLKNEIGDDLLHYAAAEADGIETLERYRGHCEPCFLFFGGGELIAVVRGASATGLHKNITDKLAEEHRVLEEGAERTVIKDPILAALEKQEHAAEQAAAEEQKRLEEQAMKPVPKQVTVVLIKPDAVKAEKTQEIIDKIKEQGMEILVMEERLLTEDEVKEFYKDQEEEGHFEELVMFMASGPSCIMVLTKGDTGEGVVEHMRDVLGPKDVEIAKSEAPDSLRAMFGTDKKMNALHGADSTERAARELSFFFPTFVAPNVPGTGPPPKIEKTLALIRPEALKQYKDAILDKIQEAGFEVCLQKEIQLTEDQAKDFYKDQVGQAHYDELIQQMINGPVLALGLAKEEAVQGWRNLLGPKEVEVAKLEAPNSLRAQFSFTEIDINAIHGSDSAESAQKELDMFFPKEHTLAVIKPDASVEHKDAIIERIKEAGFHIACQKDIEMDQDLAMQLYKEHEGKEFYDSLIEHMTSGPSMIMVLSREDAIQNWRTIMGPTDPDIAKQQAPESLRALLGKDILHNAIHGSSTKGHAVEKIKQLFPEVEVAENGTINVPTAKEATADITNEDAQQPTAEEDKVDGEGNKEAGEVDKKESESTPLVEATLDETKKEDKNDELPAADSEPTAESQVKDGDTITDGETQAEGEHKPEDESKAEDENKPEGETQEGDEIKPDEGDKPLSPAEATPEREAEQSQEVETKTEEPITETSTEKQVNGEEKQEEAKPDAIDATEDGGSNNPEAETSPPEAGDEKKE